MEKAASDLHVIEKLLESELKAQLDVLKDVASHVLFAGGKRLRPLLMILCARLCGQVSAEIFRVSIVFEYLHVASLLHDDLIDEAKVRRGKPAAHMVWGNAGAVLSGDYLLARALTIIAETKNINIVKRLAFLTTEMAQGELHQLTLKGNTEISKEMYFKIIHKKTALLMETACCVGGMLVGADVKKVEALRQYGYHLGMGFQIVDDILDYTAESNSFGKKIGTDLEEGKLTLPLILALASCKEAEKKEILQIFGQPNVSDSTIRRVVAIFKKYNSLQEAQKHARKEIDQAIEALSIFPSSEPHDMLKNIAMYAILRKV